MAGLMLMLGACNGSADEGTVNPPPPDAGGNPALVSVLQDSETSTMSPTKVVATFNVAINKLEPTFFQVSGTCATLPVANSAIDPGGKVVTVTLSGADCLGTQSVKLTLDPGAVEFAGPVIDPGAIWTRTYTVPLGAQSLGGTVTGLAGTLTLVNNGGDPLALSTDGHFEFPTLVAENAPYAVTVQGQPANQTCSVSQGSGTMGRAAVQDVQVVCSTITRTLGGTALGLSGTVALQNNGGDTQSISTDGPFSFSTPVAQGSLYAVTVSAQPATQTCTVSNGTGTVGAANISDIQVACSTNTYTVGGTVSGLNDVVVLQNNGADNLSVNSNGSFTFPTPIAQGSPYAITVLTQPASQTCSVSHGTGTVGPGNITNVDVTCATNTTTLSVSATGVIPVGSGTGSITVTNTGTTWAATNIQAQLPSGWTDVQQDSSGCISIAPNNGTCTLIFSSTTPYVAQGNIRITADNVSSSPTTALAFSKDGYLVFGVRTGSLATVVDAADISSATQWGNTGSQTGCTSETDGAYNTNCLAGFDSSSAAMACYNSTAGGVGAGTWYLPAICQLGSSDCSASGVANLRDNLYQYGFGGLASDFYWSSTESLSDGLSAQMYEMDADASRPNITKLNQAHARCVREIGY